MITHINHLNSNLSRLAYLGMMKFDDETQVVVLLSSLPDSWSLAVTAVMDYLETCGMTFDKIHDIVLGEDAHLKSEHGVPLLRC